MLKILANKSIKVLMIMILLFTTQGCKNCKTKVYYYPFGKDKTEGNRIEVNEVLADQFISQLEQINPDDGFDCYLYGSSPLTFTVIENGQENTFWILDWGVVYSYKGKCYYIDPFSKLFDTAREIYRNELEKRENEEVARGLVFEMFREKYVNAKFIHPDICDKEYKDTFFVSADTGIEDFVAQFDDTVNQTGSIGKLVSGINATVTLNGDREYTVKSISPYDNLGVIVKVQ